METNFDLRSVISVVFIIHLEEEVEKLLFELLSDVGIQCCHCYDTPQIPVTQEQYLVMSVIFTTLQKNETSRSMMWHSSVIWAFGVLAGPSILTHFEQDRSDAP